MKYRKILLKPVIISFTAATLMSCDGGGGSDSLVPNTSGEVTEDKIVINLPDDPNKVTSDGGGVAPDTNSSQEAGLEDQVFAGINQERLSRGLPTLIRDSTMDSLCLGHNNYMIQVASPGGALLLNHDNAQARADVLFGQGFKSFAENTGAVRGFSTGAVASEFVTGWANSAKHIANIAGNYTHSGIALTVDSRDGAIYATQIFGRK
jgi:uncharacterized protein YkwD